MTRREYTDAMLLDDAHPELWSEADRDAYLRWRLSEAAAWYRGVPKVMRRTTYREVIRQTVNRCLDERAHLYHPRYRHCTCLRCRPPAVTQAELDAFVAKYPLVLGSKATKEALVEIEQFKPRGGLRPRETAA